jgi:hypothetical protein
LSTACEAVRRRSADALWRILTGERAAPLPSSVLAIAECLGLAVVFVPGTDAEAMKRAQADQTARKLVSLFQKTSGPEAQAVNRPAVDEIVKQTARELHSGSGRRLWSDL